MNENINYDEQNPYIIELIDDETDETVPFEYLDTVRIDNDDYIVCIPYDEDSVEVAEVALFKIDEDENREDCLSQVTDDDLANQIYDEFKKRNADKFEFEN